MRYRYYYDPPELLTCIISIRDHWHVGLYNDLPHETPSICASNDQRTGALYSVAANLFGAVKASAAQGLLSLGLRLGLWLGLG